jgi:hypothetical protein
MYIYIYHLQISLYDNNSLYKNVSTWKLYYIIFIPLGNYILHSIYSTWKLYYIINLFGCIFPLLEILLCNYKRSGGNFPYIIFYSVPWKIPYGIGWNIICERQRSLYGITCVLRIFWQTWLHILTEIKKSHFVSLFYLYWYFLIY